MTKKPMSKDEMYVRWYCSYIAQLLNTLDFTAINDVIQEFKQAKKDGQTIFLCGNGGSASTCSHYAEDLTYGLRGTKEGAFKAISLADNIAYITAIANDEGYDNIFVKQMETVFSKGDVLVGISGSGNSPNIVKAVKYANKVGGVSIGILGFDGGVMKKLCHHYILVETAKGEYGVVEDIHIILDHLINTLLAGRGGNYGFNFQG
jgi:D-sedoheptulose 7-phosphate isomerase